MAKPSQVDLAPVRYARHINYFLVIIYLVNDTVITYPDPPLIVATSQLSAARRTRRIRESFHARNKPGDHSRG
jgi:hypothetical protein